MAEAYVGGFRFLRRGCEYADAGAGAAMCARRRLVGISTGQGELRLYRGGVSRCGVYGLRCSVVGALGRFFMIVKGFFCERRYGYRNDMTLWSNLDCAQLG